MEWQVFGVIVALCGFAGAIITPVVKLNSSITRLTVSMDGCGGNMRSRSIR